MKVLDRRDHRDVRIEALLKEIERLQTEFDKATRLVSQSIQWQRDAEIKLLKLRTATIEECARETDIQAEWYAEHDAPISADASRACGKRIRALKEQP